MKLIADSGSTKTAWKLLDDSGLTHNLLTSGINPFFRSTEDIYQDLNKTLLPKTGNEVEQIWFYGAGVANAERGEVIRKALAMIYPHSKIEVASDLLGASRALLGNEKGIACILGTGSNACLYDGEKIVGNIPPLGFILGDEGSGAVMGKHLIGDYLKEVMPLELRQKFHKQFNIDKDEVLNRVYREQKPNLYLAGFTTFLSENIDSKYCAEFVSRNFTSFIERNVVHIPDYQNIEIGFVGSVAWHFSDILKSVLSRFNLKKTVILKEPIDGLVQYHIEN